MRYHITYKLTLFAFFALLVNFQCDHRGAKEVRDKEKQKKRAKAVEGEKT